MRTNWWRSRKGPPRRRAVFSVKEVELFISSPAIPEQRRVLYAIEFLAGLRTGQVSALRWGDHEPDLKPLGKKVKTRPKTGVPHFVPVHPALAAILADWKLAGWRRWMGRDLKEDDLLVPTQKGASRDSRKSLAKFHRDLASLGLRKRRHYDTRRTFISVALAAGASKDILEEITHPRPKDSFDLYRTASWDARCKQVASSRCSSGRGGWCRFGSSGTSRKMAPEWRWRVPPEGQNKKARNLGRLQALKLAGSTGLEPVASGVTVSETGLAGIGRSLQPVAIAQGGGDLESSDSPGFGAFSRPRVTPGLQSQIVKSIPSERLLSVRQEASRLGVSTSIIYKLCSEGRLAHVRVANAIRFVPGGLPEERQA